MDTATMAIIVTASALALAGCGGSGVEPNKRIAELSDEEIADLCQWVLDTQGGSGETFSCTEHTGYNNITEVFCQAELRGVSDECPLRASAVESCAEALGDDPCSRSRSASVPTCGPVRECSIELAPRFFDNTPPPPSGSFVPSGCAASGGAGAAMVPVLIAVCAVCRRRRRPNA